MTCGDLFAGIGGISLGLERAGFDVRWQVEIDEFCNDVRAPHFPRALQYRDVRCDYPLMPYVDLIAGGFPCQDISAAGKGAGLDGERSGLWREFARIIRQLGPRWVLVENVPALRTRGADRVIDDLEAEGYTCWPLVVGARHVGAPHRRDRVWIVAHAAGLVQRKQDDASSPDARQVARPCTGGRGGALVAHGHGHGREAERSGGVLDGERAALGHDADGRYHWPSRPGEVQYEWESSRTTEPWLGRGADGVPAPLDRTIWKHRLKALGNAVVPQVVEAIGRAILAVDT